MSLLNLDIDSCIVHHIFSGSEKRNFKILKTIYSAFGKSKYHIFITQCRECYFKILFDTYKVNDIYTFLQKRIHKNNPKFYLCYRTFYKEKENSLITFKNLNNKSKIIISYLSLYYGYLVVFRGKTMYEKLGYNYWNIHNDPIYKDKPLEYWFLKRKRIHNLKYYDLVNKGNTIYDSTFILKKDITNYKCGATTELMDIDCIKI
jgi:hypothetical protein